MNLSDICLSRGLPRVNCVKKDTASLVLEVKDGDTADVERLKGAQVYPFACVQCRQDGGGTKESILRGIRFEEDGTINAFPMDDDDTNAFQPTSNIDEVSLVWPEYVEVEGYKKLSPGLGQLLL